MSAKLRVTGRGVGMAAAGAEEGPDRQGQLERDAQDALVEAGDGRVGAPRGQDDEHRPRRGPRPWPAPVQAATLDEVQGGDQSSREVEREGQQRGVGEGIRDQREDDSDATDERHDLEDQGRAGLQRAAVRSHDREHDPGRRLRPFHPAHVPSTLARSRIRPTGTVATAMPRDDERRRRAAARRTASRRAGPGRGPPSRPAGRAG